MKKPRSFVWSILALFLVLVVTIPVAGQGGWNIRALGRMTDSEDIPGLSVSINAWEKFDGTIGGQAQYQNPRDGLFYKLKVTEFCTGLVPRAGHYYDQPYAIVIGTVTGLHRTEADGGGFGAISVVESTALKPDAVWTSMDRQRSKLGIDLLDPCGGDVTEDFVYSFPHDVLEGNFSIQTR